MLDNDTFTNAAENVKPDLKLNRNSAFSSYSPTADKTATCNSMNESRAGINDGNGTDEQYLTGCEVEMTTSDRYRSSNNGSLSSPTSSSSSSSSAAVHNRRTPSSATDSGLSTTAGDSSHSTGIDPAPPFTTTNSESDTTKTLSSSLNLDDCRPDETAEKSTVQDEGFITQFVQLMEDRDLSNDEDSLQFLLQLADKKLDCDFNLPAATASSSCMSAETAAALTLSTSAAKIVASTSSPAAKLHRWTTARDNLAQQVAGLERQTSAHKEELCGLEALLDAKRKDLPAIGGSPNAADVVDEIAQLKRKCTAVHRAKLDAQRRLNLVEIGRLQMPADKKDYSIQQHNRQQQQAYQQYYGQFHQQQQAFNSHAIQRSNGASPVANADEVEKLRQTIERLVSDNQQKNIEITSLRQALGQRIEPPTQLAVRSYSVSGAVIGGRGSVPPGATPNFDINAQLRRLLMDDEMLATEQGAGQMAHSSSYSTSLCAGDADAVHPLPFQRSATALLGYTTPQCTDSVPMALYYDNVGHYYNPQPPAVSGSMMIESCSAPIAGLASYVNRVDASSPAVARQLAAELDELRHSADFRQRYSPVGHQFGHCSSFPRTIHAKSNSVSAGLSLPRARVVQRPADVFKPTHSRDERASSSSDASSGATAAAASKIVTQSVSSFSQSMNVASDDEMASGRRCADPPEIKHGRARSTLRNFFGRLARSRSQDLRHSPAAAAAIAAGSARQRSAVRPSASARFAEYGVDSAASTTLCDENTPPPLRPAIQQFVDWTPAEVCAWLRIANLGQYVPAASRFVRSGRHLLNLTGVELEKELQIKSGLHRRRLKCLLNCIERNTGDLVEPADRMNVNQVMLWLDSIGVPQYRDIFAANHIDGQMLVCLTVADLVEMQIVSAMNHATFARAIQLLRTIEFRVHRLERRFAGGMSLQEVSPADVERWTAISVADWLRGIDLAEFTPNLMFAGVHGSLMVNEPTFTAESLAEVLQIPPHRTLLRRHLTTHFNSLLGAEVISRKRDALAQPFVTHLSPMLRIKLVRKGILGARKKSKNDIFVEPHVPVCPTTRLAAGLSAITLDQSADTSETVNSDLRNTDEFVQTSSPASFNRNTTTDI